MEYRYLSNTGLAVSMLSFGSYLTFGHSVDQKQAKQLMTIAYEAGINLFDTAEIYAFGRAEMIMGDALRDLQWPRETYILMTKVFWGGEKPTQLGLHRKHIFECCHMSLQRLNTEYIDLFLCHRPDPRTSMEEIVRAMTQLIHQGKILYWGTSEWNGIEIMEALLIAERFNLIPPSLEQFEYNMISREKGEKDVIKLCQKYHIGVTTTMPLSCGLLTGKYNQGFSREARFFKFKELTEYLSSEYGKKIIEKVEKISFIAQNLNITMAQLAIAWCLKNKQVSSVIVGASHEEQLIENLRSFYFLETLNDDILKKIDEILANKPAMDNETSYAYKEL